MWHGVSKSNSVAHSEISQTSKQTKKTNKKPHWLLFGMKPSIRRDRAFADLAEANSEQNHNEFQLLNFGIVKDKAC